MNDDSIAQFSNIESNAKIIEWDDGSFSVAIGDEMFDVRKEEIHNSSIYIKYDSEIVVQKSGISDKIFVKPSHRNTRHIQMFQQKLKDHGDKQIQRK